MRKPMKLATKISLVVIALVFISVGISVACGGQWNINNMVKQYERNVLNVVQITALSPIVIEGLQDKETHSQHIQEFIIETQNNCAEIDVMVVADANGVRYGHTKNDRLGKFFSAEDHIRAIEHGETYVSSGPGTLGPSLRAFCPVRSDSGEILGFVMAGSLLDEVQQAKFDNIIMMIGFLLLGGLFGLLGALYVSKKIKISLMGYEPVDIARLYSANQGILSTVHEGIMAVDSDCKITMINQRCGELLDISIKDVQGIDLLTVFPQSKLKDAVIQGEEILDYQYRLGDMLVVSNNIPLIENGVIMGGVASFRDRSEVQRFAQEMTGVQKIIDSLRASSHEFKNKLHIILGLIESGNPEEAKKYITKINIDMQTQMSAIMGAIKDTMLSALMVGKLSRCLELKIDLTITDTSYFENVGGFDMADIALIVGNLIENALDHLNTIDKEHKHISVEITESADNLTIVIEDNGNGIENVAHIFEKGFSTKEHHRGYGLFLVSKNVEKYHGTINVQTKPMMGTKFTVEMINDEKI